MHPFIGKINLHTVDIINLFALIMLFNLSQDGINIGVGSKVYAVFGHEIIGIGSAKLAHFLSFMGQMAEEKRNAHQRIASVMRLRIDYPAVSFAAYHGMSLLHLCHHVHFAHGRSIILLSVTAGHIAQSAG